MAGENFFFGVFPEREAALEIARRAKDLQRRNGLRGKPIAAERLHISLARFNFHAADHKKLVRIAEQAALGVLTRPFDVTLDRVGSFAGAKGRYPLVFLVDQKSKAAIDALYRNLSLSLKKNVPGTKPLSSAGFNPHVTLMYADRRIDDEYPVQSVIRWKAKAFALVRSLTGKSIYQSLGEWPLAH